ncbi:hypothetical protein B5D77_12550 [Microcystis sp. MC19]|uniref:PEP-CTERM sorting domain-containing protein n=1 Tax=Microcystis sp. MC19 TaxID=1967666 RepID=UPI000D1368C2|nr:PEP-CTERM sorting domain-containing protein [Microcystis sp. MC19]AVQ72020.1 hypothetical protein B5D77_12550 [Microcystis sp. MC19]
MNRGLLAVASIGAILTLSEVANAVTFTVADFSTPNFTVTLGDKVFSDFLITGTSVDPQDQITIGFVSGVFQLNYSASPGANMALETPGTLKYKVTIPATFTNEFASAGTNAQGNTMGSPFSKSLTATNLDPSTLAFISTGPTVTGTFSAGTKAIDVTSAWTLNGPGAFINGFSDQYIQNPPNPTPIAVPEPSAVLGLAALGLAGVVGRSVSRSLHNKQQ